MQVITSPDPHFEKIPLQIKPGGELSARMNPGHL
jgi:hypothetical protein